MYYLRTDFSIDVITLEALFLDDLNWINKIKKNNNKVAKLCKNSKPVKILLGTLMAQYKSPPNERVVVLCTVKHIEAKAQGPVLSNLLCNLQTTEQIILWKNSLQNIVYKSTELLIFYLLK